MTDVSSPTPDEVERLNAALASLPESALVNDGTARAFAAAARTALAIDRADDAVVLGRAALALEPRNARAWAVVGDALWSLGRPADARVALEEAIALDDKDLTAAVACARAQAACGATSPARALLTFVLTRTHSVELRAAAERLLADLTTTTTTSPTPPATTAPATTAAPADGVDVARRPPPTRPSAGAPAGAPVGRTPRPALVSDTELANATNAAAALAGSAHPAVAHAFGAAKDALGRVKKATSVEIPLRLAVTTGKANANAAPSSTKAPPKLPQDVPGLLKQRGDVVTFYPADEAIKPFDVSAEAAEHLPKGVAVIARATRKSVELALPDGTSETAPVYAVSGSGLQPPRARFVGVVDLVAGEPFVRDLVPPPRLVRLPDVTAGGQPWAEGAVLDLSTTDGPEGTSVTVNAELAAAGSPRARTWAVAGSQRLDAVFSAKCQAEASSLASSQPAALADPSLVDLTAQPFFAIDNPGSTDIDQAMCLQTRPDGGYQVSYALADASHYIKPGMALFDEAMQRGASYYLPGLSIPMLPEELSEGAISLNAHEEHRALVLTIALDKDGNVEGPAQVQRAKIRSQAQLTYGGVSSLLQEKKAIAADEHGKPVPRAVASQLALFEEIGSKRIGKARERGVVEPERREMSIAFNHDRFFLADRKADYASKLNAELSILANTGGAEALLASKVPGLWVPGIFKTHEEPDASTYAALGRQVDVVVTKNKLPDEWRWDGAKETLSAWVERIKRLPGSSRERSLSMVLQTAAVRINVASTYEREPGTHSGLKVNAYGRFSAPMREQVGVVSHAVLFAKSALETAAEKAGLSTEEARALWAPLLLGSTVEPADIPEPRRALAARAQALLTTPAPQLPALARALAAEAVAQAPSLSSSEQKLVDDTLNRAMNAGNSSKMRQGQVEVAALRLLFDDLFMSDLGGDPLGNPNAPRRAGVVTAVTPGRVFVQLNDPDVEVKLTVDDLRRHCPNAKFRLDEEGCALVTDDQDAGPLTRLVVGADVKLVATHHDGERLHFAIAENGGGGA